MEYATDPKMNKVVSDVEYVTEPKTKNVRYKIISDVEYTSKLRQVANNDKSDSSVEGNLEEKDDHHNDGGIDDKNKKESAATNDIMEDETESQSLNPKVWGELRRLYTFYNPTECDIGEIALVGGTDESYTHPVTFEDAWNHPKAYDRKKWRDVIVKEFKDMREKGVGKKVKLKEIPKNRRLIGCRWVHKLKRNGVFQARLVALGYSQIPSLDCTENYAPVIQDVTFPLICLMMLLHGWLAEIVDVETAFLYGELEEQIFMKVPDGYETVVKYDVINRKEECLMLMRTIYGTVQAARQFYQKLSNVLSQKLSMRKCLADQCLFMRKTEKGTVMLAIYIDDTLCIGPKAAVDEFKADMKKHFCAKEEGPMEEYVGYEIKRTGKHKLFMCQSNLINKLDRIFGDKVKGLSFQETPAGTGFTVTRCQVPEQLITLEEQRTYRSGVGILLYLVKFSRPDISNAVRELSKASDGADRSSFKRLL